jgi:hypothetical protein
VADDIVRVKTRFASDWAGGAAARRGQITPDMVIGDREIGYDRERRVFKVGAGVTAWGALPVALPPGGDLAAAPEQYLAPGDDALQQHILSDSPHPAYDDMPDLVTLFENGLI